MKIALLGYGKMGKEIELQALAKGHEIVFVVDEINADTYTAASLGIADVAIEFSTPGSAVNNIYNCFEAGIPVVVGTTGWLDQFEAVKSACSAKNQAFFYASNYSVGVNIFFEINRKLALLMKGQNQYNVSMEEIHHTQKLDAPSGTAISLANDILERSETKHKWVCDVENRRKENEKDALNILALRREQVPGTHTVTYFNDIDSIEIKHTAYNRRGFATGALLAAEWIVGKKGIFNMQDILKF